ncbi:MAG: hypothetical protein KBF59_02285 [Ignavibacterium sp.]|nr:hypothetical protein [Ignavibacterium sp.]
MIKKEFPKTGKVKEGTSDGWQFRIDFWDDSGKPTLVKTLREFLDSEGYDEIPLPPNDERLFWDYLRPNEDEKIREFIWHPVIIRPSVYKENAVELYIYNENFPDHKKMWDDMLNH